MNLIDRRAWRATLHEQELLSVGFDKAREEQKWPLIVGLLKAKGLPDWCLADGADFKAEEQGNDIVLEFEG